MWYPTSNHLKIRWTQTVVILFSINSMDKKLSNNCLYFCFHIPLLRCWFTFMKWT